jgi:hypothetical protein
MTSTNYAELFNKFSNSRKAAVEFHDLNWTNSAITRERIKRLSQARTELLGSLPETRTEIDDSDRQKVLTTLAPTDAHSVALSNNEWAKVEKLLGAGRNFARIIEHADRGRLAAILDQLPTHLDAQADNDDEQTAAIVAEVQELVFSRLVDVGDQDATNALEAEKVTGRAAAWEQVISEVAKGEVSIEAWSALNRFAPDEREAAQESDGYGVEAAGITDKVRSLDHIARNVDAEAPVAAE